MFEQSDFVSFVDPEMCSHVSEQHLPESRITVLYTELKDMLEGLGVDTYEQFKEGITSSPMPSSALASWEVMSARR